MSFFAYQKTPFCFSSFPLPVILFAIAISPTLLEFTFHFDLFILSVFNLSPPFLFIAEVLFTFTSIFLSLI